MGYCRDGSDKESNKRWGSPDCSGEMEENSTLYEASEMTYSGRRVCRDNPRLQFWPRLSASLNASMLRSCGCPEVQAGEPYNWESWGRAGTDTFLHALLRKCMMPWGRAAGLDCQSVSKGLDRKVSGMCSM